MNAPLVAETVTGRVLKFERKLKQVRDEMGRDLVTDGEEDFHEFDGGLLLSDEQLEAEADEFSEVGL